LLLACFIAVTDVQPEIWAEVTGKNGGHENLAKQKAARSGEA